MANYPTNLDTFSGTTATGTSLLSSPDHAADHRILGTAAYALEQKVGVGAGTPKLDYALIGTGNGTSVWGTVWNNATFGTPVITGGTLSGAFAATSGTINSVTLGTPVVDHFTSSSTAVPTKSDHALAPTVGTIADSAGGTITANAAIYQVVEVTLGTAAGNRTMGTPLNPSDGLALSYRLKQNSGNTGTVIFDTGVFRFSSNIGTPALGTASTWNYYGWRYNATDTKWDFQGQSTDII